MQSLALALSVLWIGVKVTRAVDLSWTSGISGHRTPERDHTLARKPLCCTAHPPANDTVQVADEICLARRVAVSAVTKTRTTMHPCLITAADMDLVVVTFNYRVGPYGFLASEEIQKDGDTNIGLLDQRKVLQWFGGDPGHVVLARDSAGAESITLHLPRFPGSRHDALVERVGCANENNTLACFRVTDTNILQGSHTSIPFPGRKNASYSSHNPIVDGDFLGKFFKVPSVFGDDTNEGTIFTPSNLSTIADIDNFLLDNFPNLNASMLDTINELYSRDCIRRDEVHMPRTNVHRRIGTTNPEDQEIGLGVFHTVEVSAIWGSNNTEGEAPDQIPPSSYTTSRSYPSCKATGQASYGRSILTRTEHLERLSESSLDMNNRGSCLKRTRQGNGGVPADQRWKDTYFDPRMGHIDSRMDLSKLEHQKRVPPPPSPSPKKEGDFACVAHGAVSPHHYICQSKYFAPSYILRHRFCVNKTDENCLPFLGGRGRLFWLTYVVVIDVLLCRSQESFANLGPSLPNMPHQKGLT
ncbi:Alpha/Beta hydrolase protein [Phellopilus nigrolimitatus]|nr:Alpha/Beta hydrolase protein [Phellopilus nigrolimitatus]